MKRSDRIWIVIAVVSAGVFVGLNLGDIRHLVMIARTSAQIPASVSIPFELERGLIVVTTELAGRPVEMIVDSAAFDTRLSAETARAAGIEARVGNDVGDTFGRRQQMGIAVLPEWQVERATWNRATAGILSWGDGAFTPCVAPDGIIGGTTMKHASWAFDFATGTIHIGEPDRLPESYPASLLTDKLPIRRSRVALEPRVEATVNGTSIDGLLVDTGSNGDLVLPMEVLEELGIPQDEWIVVDDAASAGIFGTTEVKSILAPVQFQLGNTAPIDVFATFTDGSEPKIGNAILSRYSFAILPKAQELHIGLRTDVAQSPVGEPLRHGIFPSLSAEGDAWVIVYRERPWSSTGDSSVTDPLAVGTRFETINGLRPSEVFESHCSWFLGIRDFIDRPELVLVDSFGDEVRL